MPCVLYIVKHLFVEHLINEEIVFLKGTMSIGRTLFGCHVGQRDRYKLDYISNFRLTPDLFMFDYETEKDMEPIAFEHNGALDLPRPNFFLHNLSNILAYHSHSVERVVFGKLVSPDDDPYLTLHNPDVSALICPCIHLKLIMIETATYDAYHLERFMTYAVNVIGQNYLKQYVDVYIYGAMEKLQSNLQNNLTNLCRRIYINQQFSGSEYEKKVKKEKESS